MEETISDFIFIKKDLDEELQVYNLAEINDYIELATNTAQEVCSSIKNNTAINKNNQFS
jgi:hypothetical protein